jgi:hypothetical protein
MFGTITFIIIAIHRSLDANKSLLSDLYSLQNCSDIGSASQESTGDEKQCSATYKGLLKMIELRGGLDMLPRPIAYQISRSVHIYRVFEVST